MPYHVEKVKNGFYAVVNGKRMSKKPHKLKKTAIDQLVSIYKSENPKDLSGAGFFDFFSNIKKAFSGPRLDYRPKDRDFIKTYGDYKIVGLTAMRKPLDKAISTILNVISLGTFKSAISKNYDEMYHLFLKVDLELATPKQTSRRSIVLEKNETIQISEWKDSMTDGAHSLPLVIKPDITFKQFLDNALNSTDPKTYFLYDSISNNCQSYILLLLKANGLLALNPTAKDFIYQDTTELKKELPSFTQKIMKGVTDFAARADVALHGYGLLGNEHHNLGY